VRAGVAGIVEEALNRAFEEGALAPAALPAVAVERARRVEFGDFSTNAAMVLSPLVKRKPREIAAALSERIALNPLVERCEVAGPGFINIFLKRSYWYSALAEIFRRGAGFGTSAVGASRSVHIEFVSANPTGPLHIGHGRGAAVGASLAEILKAAGFSVTREYYINDAGRQVYTLGESVRMRIEELRGAKVEFPADFYRGEYVKEMAADFLARYGAPGSPGAPDVKEFAMGAMLEGIRKDLSDFGVAFDVWYSERGLEERGLVADTIEELRGKGHIFESEGALWFRTTRFGDDKDRVLVKADGERTYFASDIAYHREKARMGFSAIVNVWGADHHGYEGRVRALFKALGYDDGALKVIFIQLVALMRNGAPVPMGKREGEFVTLKQVMDEVGRDACRFFFLMRRSDAHLDFDLDLAKSQAPENPVYYVQYCHARIRSIIAFAREKGIEAPEGRGEELFARLELGEELEIIKHLAAFEETIERSALDMEPHRITFYLMDLAALFHPYYNRNRVVSDDLELTRARLLLCGAVATVVEKGLRLLGVAAPSKM
jgi:arginyl-tRNA synthetase